MKSTLLAVALFVGGAAAAAAQTPPSWDRGSSLAVAAGVSQAHGETRGLVGGSVSWETSAHFALEGTGRWMDRGSAPGAYAAELAVRVGLGGTRDGAVPYLLAGAGLHRRSFDVGSSAFDVDRMPAFYRRRLGPLGAALGQRQTFTDPALVFGGGVDVALSRTVVLRPDVRALVVFDGRHRNSVVVATVGIGYRFEHKPVTPARR
jgi:opacity protein-like surface antigen